MFLRNLRFRRNRIEKVKLKKGGVKASFKKHI